MSQGNFKPRLSSVNAFLSQQVAMNRPARAVNQVENVKERKLAELEDLNARPIMNNNKMGFTTFNSFLNIVYGEEGKRVYNMKVDIEKELVEQKIAYEEDDIYKVLLSKALGSGDGYVKLFGIKTPGLLFDKCEKDSKLYSQCIWTGLEVWMDLVWDQTRVARTLPDGSLDEMDELPAIVRKRKLEEEAEQARVREEADRSVAKRRKKTTTAVGTSASTLPASSSSDAQNTTELDRLKTTANAARAGASSSTAASGQTVDVNGLLSFAMDRASKKDEAKAAEKAKRDAELFKANANDWEKAIAILQNKAYIRDGCGDLLTQTMEDAGCLEADDLKYSSQKVRCDLSECLREAPRNRFKDLAQVAVGASGVRGGLGMVSPPPMGHIFGGGGEGSVSSGSSGNTSDT